MTLPAAYFDDLYATTSDPWKFKERWYEQRKRALTLALLPAEQCETAFEPGCSNGVLTRALAGRCGTLLATDVSPAAIQAASDHNADLPHVQIAEATLPRDWPSGHFDLVILSELMYYFDPTDAAVVAARAAEAGETVISVHWRHPVADYPLTGDQAQGIVRQEALAAGMTELARHVEADLIAEVWSHDGRSVAARTGLI